MLAASAPGSESFEIAVDDNVRGAFSWAALAVLERWGIHRTAADTHFDITYGHLRQRVDALLKAMNVEQAAHFDAQADQAARKVFAELRSIELGTPDRPFFTGGREVSPGSNGYVNRYQIVQKDESGSSPTWTVMADLYAPGTGCGNALKAGVMYWVEQSAGWATFYDALSALTSDVSFKMTPKPAIDYSKDVQGLTLEQSILAGQTYETGAIWLQIDAPTLSTGTLHGKFTYDAKECYVCGDSDGRLVWLLDKDVSLPSNGWLLDTTSPDLHIQKTGATLSGDYFEADDA